MSLSSPLHTPLYEVEVQRWQRRTTWYSDLSCLPRTGATVSEGSQANPRAPDFPIIERKLTALVDRAGMKVRAPKPLLTYVPV